MYPGYCYKCGKYTPTGHGHYERHFENGRVYWKIKCVKCASGRTTHETDREVKRAKEKKNGREKIQTNR